MPAAPAVSVSTKPSVPSSTKPLTKEEQEEADALKELNEIEQAGKDAARAVTTQAVANAEADLRVAVAQAGTVAQRPPPRKPVEPKFAGDIPVTCLKTEPFCKLGGRAYNLKRGQEIMMLPAHADELSQGPEPWVAPITVVVRRD